MQLVFLLIAPAFALSSAAPKPPAAFSCAPFAITKNVAYGNNTAHATVADAAACCRACSVAHWGCVAWTFKQTTKFCFLTSKRASPDLHPKQQTTSGLLPPPPPPPTPPPVPPPPRALNVLMIAIDDMRPEMEPYGHSHMHTPNLQRLADRSTLFTNAYVQVAVCMPSRTALLSSRRPDTTMDWDISPQQWPRTCGGNGCGGGVCGDACGMRNITFLPGWFKDHGYWTQGAGKIFHEGADTQNQDYRYSWTPETTNPKTGIFEATGGPTPRYGNVSGATPSWYAFDVEDEAMTETKLALHAVEAIANLTRRRAADSASPPFFLAVGFHKPHVPWYAPKKYWDFYPNDTVALAPHTAPPVDAPAIALQDVIRAWSTPKRNDAGAEHPTSCKYTDLCAELWGNASGDMSQHTPYDGSVALPNWKARELRRAYWASLSYTDANIGRVLDALDASPFANDTVVALWGDHGYQLGDNDMWAKQSNFEQATNIPFMLHVPGARPGLSAALVEAVDLFPTLVAASTMRGAAGPVALPRCPASAHGSRAEGLCTEGFSLLPLVMNGGGNGTAGAGWGRAAFSQFTRPNAAPSGALAGGVAGGGGGGGGGDDPYMGYTVRVSQWRYTGWFRFNHTAAQADFSHPVATELYAHDPAKVASPLPIDFGVESENIVGAEDKATQKVAADLHAILVKCAPRPDLCTAADFAPYVAN